MWVDEGGLIFYLVYEFERLRLLPGLDRSISNNCSSSNRTNNARAGFAPDELLGSGTTQPRPCIISSNTFATDKGRCDRSLARSAWENPTPKDPSRRVRFDSGRCTHESIEAALALHGRHRQAEWFPKCLGSVSDHLHLCLSQLQENGTSIEQQFEQQADTDLSRRVLGLLKKQGAHFDQEISMGLAAPDHTVPYGTVLSRTLSQALRARLRSVCPYGTGLQTLRNGD